ncbi:MAG: biotin transporter BioY [Lachnospiraceae bacterium]|nr:biotin transporter BioY [Lachnospiraceae bacterium]
MENRQNLKTLNLVYIAIGAALIVICSWISIPTAVPFTLQTFAVFLLLLLLGGKRGTLSVIVYILLGLVGLPVFAGFSGGPGVLLGSTGGYIIGFIFMGLIHICASKFFENNSLAEVISLIIGLIVCYAFGSVWFMYIYMRDTGEVGFVTVLLWCVIPFIVPDLIKLALAFLISKRVKRYIK